MGCSFYCHHCGVDGHPCGMDSSLSRRMGGMGGSSRSFLYCRCCGLSSLGGFHRGACRLDGRLSCFDRRLYLLRSGFHSLSGCFDALLCSLNAGFRGFRTLFHMESFSGRGANQTGCAPAHFPPGKTGSTGFRVLRILAHLGSGVSSRCSGRLCRLFDNIFSAADRTIQHLNIPLQRLDRPTLKLPRLNILHKTSLI